MEYHLSYDFYHDDEGVLCQSPLKYILQLLDVYVRLFGVQPRQYASPLAKGDHPELDNSQELGIEDIKKNQTLIGCLPYRT